MNDISALLPQFKTAYLDNRNIGIRRFVVMTKIRRPRLKQLFAGTAQPTRDEVEQITSAMNQIETIHQS